MANLFKYVVTLVFIGGILFITFPNREIVQISLYPFFESINLSLAMIFTFGVFFGFIWGALIVWLNGSNLRNNFRNLRKRLKILQNNNPKNLSKDIVL